MTNKTTKLAIKVNLKALPAINSRLNQSHYFTFE